MLQGEAAEFLLFYCYFYFIILQGHISRQEAVSMIPPLLLDIQSNSRVSVLITLVYVFNYAGLSLQSIV